MTKILPAWKKGLAISLVLSIAAALFVFFRNFNEETLESLLKVRSEYLLVAALMVFALWVIEGLRIKLLTATLGGAKISLYEAVQVYLMTFFFASVTPLAAGEWPAHIYALSRHGLSLGESTAITVARAFLTRFLFTASAIFFIIFFRGRLVPTFLNSVFIYAAFVSVITLLLLFFLLWKPVFVKNLLQKIGSFTCKKFLLRTSRGEKIYYFLSQELRNFLYSADFFKRFRWGNLFVLIFLTVAFWLCLFSIAPVILIGLNKPAPYFQSLVWQIVIQMIIIYVPLPGGSGVAELSLASLFIYFVPSSVLGIFVVVWRFFTYYVLLFFGGVVAIGNLKPSRPYLK